MKLVFQHYIYINKPHFYFALVNILQKQKKKYGVIKQKAKIIKLILSINI